MSKESTDPRTLLAEARTLITGRIGPLNAWLGRNLRALIDGYAAALDDVARLSGNAADELRQPRACAICGACETHDVPAEIARLRAEVEFRRANPLHCAVSKAGEITFECDAAKPCAPCVVRHEIKRLREEVARLRTGIAKIRRICMEGGDSDVACADVAYDLNEILNPR